jgi:hypothetical protein
MTDRQIAVLAAVERLGEPTLPDLHREFPHLPPSMLARSLSALSGRGLVQMSGDPQWIYLGDPTGVEGAPELSDEDIVRFRSVTAT